MEKHSKSYAYLVDAQRELKGIIHIEDVIELKKKKENDLSAIAGHDFYTTTPDTAIADLLGTALQTKLPIVVINDDNKFLGIVSREIIITEVNDGVDESDTPTVFSEILEETETFQNA
jgi:glycine betaine/proline transport system ATP-binding protein